MFGDSPRRDKRKHVSGMLRLPIRKVSLRRSSSSRRSICSAVSILLALAASASGLRAAPPGEGWIAALHEIIPLYGHRNWIVIADSAYPAQSRDGVQTILSNADQLVVLHHVLAEINNSRHVRPIVYTDKELNYVPEADAPGVSQYRRNLSGMLGTQNVQSLPHEQIISRLDEAGKTFRVLIIKTNMTIPYTSVFLQLDCAYWAADAEKRLREAMNASPAQ